MLGGYARTPKLVMARGERRSTSKSRRWLVRPRKLRRLWSPDRIGLARVFGAPRREGRCCAMHRGLKVVPRVEAGRARAKTPPQDLQRTLPAILWRHRNGAEWRAVLEDRGSGSEPAQIFLRWSRAGVRERLLGLVQERDVPRGKGSPDGAQARVHPKAIEAAKRGNPWPSGRMATRLAARVRATAPKRA